MPCKISSIKDSALRAMIDGNDNFDILKQVRNQTILAVATQLLDKVDLPCSFAEVYTKDLVKKLDDIKSQAPLVGPGFIDQH